ncbi:uncharacterized protein BXIN_1100 [Babesia sp. Xinjiang]|uniref:uncharacterized protein n=1 Tax=Babesia sp. Xinjiang TaxID=462227 RepID=UPI000A25A115|nr:uncharacterized protein BXIN_1100 [Babesia sp. Xinjiang]ORM42288.1 hypothetical protein BXIN_1100 [Babesia sp. Xinjiang]
MAIRFGNQAIVIFAVLLIGSIYPIQSLVLDLTRTYFNPCIDVFEGTFKNGGIYRMFHSHDPIIRLVTYGQEVLGPSTTRVAFPSDVYVQEYRRGDRRIVAVTHFITEGARLLKTTYYKIVGTRVSAATRPVKNAFIGGPISLKLDLDSPKAHPFISASDKDGEYQPSVWSIIPRSRYPGEPAVGRMIFRYEVYFISPVINIDQQFRDHNSPSPSLISHSTNIRVSRTGDSTIISIKHGSFSGRFIARTPPTGDGIFRPKNIILSSYDFSACTQGPHLTRRDVLKIDISSIETNVPEIVILANLRRGDWLYTQYSL